MEDGKLIIIENDTNFSNLYNYDFRYLWRQISVWNQCAW